MAMLIFRAWATCGACYHPIITACFTLFTAISRTLSEKVHATIPKRHCSSKKLERMALEVMDVCLRLLKESNKGRFDSYSVRNAVLILSHITFRDCRVHIFSDNLSRNSFDKPPVTPETRLPFQAVQPDVHSPRPFRKKMGKGVLFPIFSFRKRGYRGRGNRRAQKSQTHCASVGFTGREHTIQII